MAPSPEIQEHEASSRATENNNGESIVLEHIDSKRPQSKHDQHDSQTTQDIIAEPPREYLKGWRLYVLTFALCLSLFLSTLETTIVSTSLISITNALGDFEQRDWVVTAYLITYTGFLVVYAKFSDILGRKLLILVAIAFFTIFSIVCGSISNMIQLIVFRSLQGVGASGIYAMVTVIQPELVPPEKWGNYIAVVSLVSVLSSVLGPILGGAINDHSSWRWVFLLNAPAGVAATALIAFVMPTHFPNLDNPTVRLTFRTKITRASLRRLDVLGAILLLFSSALIVFAFEEAGSRYSWKSPAILSTIIIGGVLFIGFIAWEKVVDGPRAAQEPIFPLRLMKDRMFSALILIGLCTGPPFMTVLINLPQRFQAVDGASAFEAGIHLLPLLLASPVATVVAGQFAGKFKVPPFYILLFGASMQLLGIGLASSISFTSGKAMYGYEVIMGFGFGMSLVSLLIFTPMVVKRSDMAVAMGAITQIRVLGGTIGLAISSTILNNHLSSDLPTLLSPTDIQQISDSVQYINTLPDATRDAVRQVFADGYSSQLRVMMYFSAVVWIFAATLWERKLRSAATMEGY
ncbi:drug resistance transporter EmrB/QacA subfamily [Annulohypoxylon maeteangense]|uniref:drug resistance transporter EmrB/QacA subfamily n=1 Tax=Annulohypoxylon maeteangense TaxID=1927788 RepID=UPI0020080626|nr:drug resistance transporter EmrB/QacA subfamily [Annulohypoxylon maeteangense]KAI0888580.1 drug resistance transporter EmrB/QacA subfamily [Annulohypoxylon maeteangense]